MKVVMHKWFWFWDFEKEEKWLNAMSSKGLQLVGVGFCKYTFEESVADEYTYRLELMKKDSKCYDSISYIHFIEDTGAEHIATYLRWVYFRKKKSYGDFNLFSDLSSKISYMKRLIIFLSCFLPLIISALYLNLPNGINGNITSMVLTILLFLELLLYFFGISILYSKLTKLKKEQMLRE